MGKDTQYEFTDRGMFNWVMGHYTSLCSEVLSTILGVGIDHVTVGSEQFMEPRLDKKAGVLDIKAVAVDGRAFDIEMQAVKTGNLPRRARLYQALVDSELLEKGGEYASLPNSYVIFICGGDYLEHGEPILGFQMTSSPDEGSHLLKDGRHVVFLSCSLYGKVDDEKNPGLSDFMRFVAKGKASEHGLTRELEEAVSESNKNKDARDYIERDSEIREYKEAAKLERAAGDVDGRTDLSKLIGMLLDEGKIAEARSVTDDLELQDRLMVEYGIRQPLAS